MARAAVQLYTLRNVDRPLVEVLELVAEAGFDGVEFAYRVPEEDPDEIAAVLDETGLEVAGAHIRIGDLEDDVEETVAFYGALGCEDAVVPHLGEEYFSSRDGIEAAVERLDAVEESLAGTGIGLHYHNHNHEYVDLDGGTGFDAFVEASHVGIELDLGLALLGGDDPRARLEALGDRARLVHLKDVDVDAGESVPLGEGDLDIDGCAETFRANDGEWLIYEYEGEDPLASLDDAAATVQDLC